MIDVRSPVEFAQGHLPGAVNLPILNNDERALIGTTYKNQGRDVAVELGYRLISGDVKAQRLDAWKSYIETHPHAVIYCFRGGLRSQITRQWLAEAGIRRPLVLGGYKSVRQFLIQAVEKFTKESEVLLISGPTGSRKTRLLRSASPYHPAIDLEAIAKHRGSAFGASGEEQPSQTDFENIVAVKLLKLQSRWSTGPFIIEDESRLIGRNAIPMALFEKMRRSPAVWVEEPFEVRVENIFQDYILHARRPKLELFAQFKKAVLSIQKKLGSERAAEMTSLIEAAEAEYLSSGLLEKNKRWIELLLTYYYDPMYMQSIDKRQVRIVFKGSGSDCENYLRNLK